MTPELQHNLEALTSVTPALAERLCLPVDGSHVRIEEGRRPSYRVHRYFYPFTAQGEELDRTLEAVSGERDLLLFGIGLGEQLDRLLERSEVRRIAVWDRDPWLVRLTLSRRDYSDEIRDGRLQLLLGSDLIDAVALAPRRQLVVHPFLDQVYRFERDLLEVGLPEQFVLLRSGTLFVDDLAAALRREGYGIYTLDADRLAKEEIELAVQRFQPAFVAAINYTTGLAEFCHEAGCPLMCWEIDPSTSRLARARTPTERAFIFTYRDANVAAYRGAGFERVEHLPLATEPQRRQPVRLTEGEQLTYGAPISFVGASMVVEGIEYRQMFLKRYGDWLASGGEGTLEEGTRRLDEALALQRQDFARYRLPALLKERFGTFLAACGEDEENPLMWVSEIAASEKRLTYVATLGRLGAVAWGDAGWKQVERFGARYSGRYARHDTELTRIYCASTINVDVGRLYQSDIVTMRVFDVLSCGGFLLAERSEDLGQLFEIGVEVEAYTTLEELMKKAAFYLTNPEAARAIAERGMRAVRTRHTIRQRVEHMLGVMGVEREGRGEGEGEEEREGR